MVKPDNYVMLLGWMRTELNLKGNELNLYAIIYGFTQDGETEFSGSIRYMQEWLGAESKQTVFNTLDKLIKKGLVQKRTEVVNGIKHNYYLAAPRGSLKIRPPQSNFYTGVVQNLDHPSPNFRPNNIEDNIEDLEKMLDMLTDPYTHRDLQNVRKNRKLETNIGKLFSLLADGFEVIHKNAELVRLWDDLENAEGAVLDRWHSFPAAMAIPSSGQRGSCWVFSFRILSCRTCTLQRSHCMWIRACFLRNGWR